MDFSEIEKEIATPLIIALAAAHATHEETGSGDDLKDIYESLGNYLAGLTVPEIAAIVMVTAERGSDFLRALAATDK
jgi:hypothetical protein